jgi:phosphoglycerate dehydrogenase-like enzyme
VADVDSVIISAGHQAGQPPLVDDTVLRAMRPGAWLVNIARGTLLDADAAIAHLNAGHLAGIGLDVFPAEPYPADGPLATRASWRPPTPPPSPVTTSQPPADDSATP